MRRKDKQLEKDEAMDVLARAEYGSLATIDGHGRPYTVPVHYVLDGKSLYIHCAREGKKLDNIKNNPEVCISAVRSMKIVPNELSTAFESAVANGRAAMVSDEAEIRKALLAMVEKYDMPAMPLADKAIEKNLKAVAIIRVDIYKVTGKADHRELLD